MFGNRKAPFRLGKTKYKHITQGTQIALLIVWIASIVIYNLNGYEGITILINGLVAVAVSLIVEVLFKLSKKESYDSWIKFIKDCYCKENILMIPLLSVLLLPLHTPLYLIVVAVIMSVWIGKLVFGGYGFSIFNPGVVGVLFVQLSFKAQLAFPADMDGNYPLQLLKTATQNMNIARLHPYDALLFNGGYGMSVGTASIGLLILLFIVLSIIKAIDWRVAITYVLTVFGITAFMGGLVYAQEHVLSGLVIFGAVFLVSENVTSPTSRETKLLYAVIVGLITVMVRTIGSNVEGVLFAVLVGNMFTPYLNRTVKQSNIRGLLKVAVFAIIVIVAAGFALNAIIEARSVTELAEFVGVMM